MLLGGPLGVGRLDERGTVIRLVINMFGVRSHDPTGLETHYVFRKLLPKLN